jgi:PhnB protein
MSATPSPVPDNRSSPCPYLIVRDGRAAIDFYQATLGARLAMALDAPNGAIGHAELRVGDGYLMLADEYPEMGSLAPPSVGGSPVTIHLYVPDVDAVAAKMVAQGATVLRPVADQFYGDRGGKLQDPFGHLWWLASRKEVLSVDEIRQRAAALFGGAAG